MFETGEDLALMLIGSNTDQLRAAADDVKQQLAAYEAMIADANF